MKVLDATFLIDYLHGADAAYNFYQNHDYHHRYRWIIPVPAYAEVIVGLGNAPEWDVSEWVDFFNWAEIQSVDKETAIVAAEIAEEIGAEGPHLSGMDGLIAAVGRQNDAPVVSSDGDLTHPETKKVIAVEEYL